MFRKTTHISLTFCILISILTFSCKGITYATKSTKLNSNLTKTDSSDTTSTSYKLYFIDNTIPSITMYRIINSQDGSTCILLTMDGLISFNYTTKFSGVEETDTFVPASNERGVDLSGDCGNDGKASMLLTWKTFALHFHFTKTPSGEKWYVGRIRLSFSTKESTFKHPVYDNTNVNASSSDETLFLTPVGRSFKCHKEIEVSLSDRQYPDLKIKLLLRKLTLQPFMFNTDNFGPEYSCTTTVGSFRNETIPFVFGIFMTIAVLCAVGGYAAYRSYRVEKVQYNSME